MLPFSISFSVRSTLGKLPDFLRDLHRLTALATKVHRKWEGSVWDSNEASAVLLNTPEAIAEKIAYVMANPTAVGAVRYAKDWPGPYPASTHVAEAGLGKLFRYLSLALYDIKVS